MAHVATRLPQKYELGAVVRPADSNEVVTTDGGDEQVNERWAYPLHEIELNIVPQRIDDTDWLALRDLYYQVRTAHTFLFRDFHDYQLTAEQIGVGDGTTTEFQVIKHYGSVGLPGGRRISRIASGTLSVTLGGSATSAYTADLATGIITFTTAPGVGVIIAVSCEFDMRVRFAEPVDFTGIDYRTRQAVNIVLREKKEA